MAKSATFANDLLKLVFNGTPIAGLADNAASAALTSLYAALHTADPTAAGSQTTSEIVYTGYARVAVPRSISGFQVSGSSVSPVTNVDFPVSTGGSATASFWSVGTLATGAGKVLYSGPLTPSVLVTSGAVPRITPDSTVMES